MRSPRTVHVDRATRPLWLAIHETGHVVAHLVLDELPPCPAPFIRAVTIEPGEGSLGHVESQVRVFLPWDEDGNYFASLPPELRLRMRQSAYYDAVQFIAGHVAERHQRDGWMGAFWLEQPTIERLIRGDLDADPDMLHFRLWLEWLAPHNVEAEAHRLWRIACALVASEWAGIQRFAKILRDRRTMEGEEIEETWGVVRSSKAQRERSERHLGKGLAGWRDRIILPELRRAG